MTITSNAASATTAYNPSYIEPPDYDDAQKDTQGSSGNFYYYGDQGAAGVYDTTQWQDSVTSRGVGPYDAAAAAAAAAAAPDEGSFHTANVDTAAVGVGGYDENSYYAVSDNNDWVGSSFSDKKIRHSFIKKVYLILLIQLSITTGIICLFLFCNPVKEWVQANSWFYWTSYGVFFATYIFLACVPSLRRRVPINCIFLLIFTLALSYMAGTISSYYSTEIVLVCIGITAALCLAISLFAIQTKIDFTLCAGLLFALFMILVYSGITCLIYYLIGFYYYMNVLWGALAAVFFALLLVFDTQRVVGGKNRHFQLSPEEYITGAMELYVDIVYLLIILISCVANN